MKLKTTGMRNVERSSVEQHYCSIISAHQNKKNVYSVDILLSLLYPHFFLKKKAKPKQLPEADILSIMHNASAEATGRRAGRSAH